MKRIINAPSRYIQGEHEIENLHAWVTARDRRQPMIVVDRVILEMYKASILKSFKAAKMPAEVWTFGGECSDDEINAIAKEMKRKSCDIVIGVGGGKTVDTVKAVAHQIGCPVIVAPTAASSDAPCSALSVIYKPTGEFDRYLILPTNPDFVIVDTFIVSRAPVRLLVSGMGDALSTYYEARACMRSGAAAMAGGNGSISVMALAKACRDTLFQSGFSAKRAAEQQTMNKELEDIIEANTYLSGLGFESGGLAGAHAIHNGFSVLEETHAALHGEKVAFGTLTQLVLEEAPLKERDEVVAFCRKVGLTLTLAGIGVKAPSKEKLMAVANAACAEGETIGNMPMKITPEDVYKAILEADQIGQMG